MLNNPTVEKLKEMKLKVMAQLLSEPDPTLNELSFEERLGIMVEKEWLSKKNSRIKRLLNNATLGVNACIEDIDYTQDRCFLSGIWSRYPARAVAGSFT